MSLVKHLWARFLSLTEYSLSTSLAVFACTAFVVIFGIDLLSHVAGWSWLEERFIDDALEAVILTLVAYYLFRLREERILRRQREMKYLNHHVRNALASIQFAQHALSDIEQRATAVSHATSRICSVLEQLARNEHVAINERAPEKYKGAA